MRLLTLAYATKTPQCVKFVALSVLLTLAPLSASAAVDKGEMAFYGHVNKSVLGYHDSEGGRVSIYDNNVSSTRMGLKKTEDLGDGFAASVLFEVQISGASSSRRLSQNEAARGNSTFNERHTRVGLGHDRAGVLFLGRTSSASDGITEMDMAPVGNALTTALTRYGANLNFRQEGSGNFTAFDFAQVVDNFDGIQFAGGSASDGTNAYGNGFTDRFNLIKYTSPKVNGFEFSAAAAQGGNHDFAVRYENDLPDAGLKVKAGVAYVDYRDITDAPAGTNEVKEQWSGSATVKSDTGLAATVAYGQRNYAQKAAGIDTPRFYYGKVGYFWGKWGAAVEHGQYKNIDTTSAADTTLYSYGLGLERDLGRGVGVSAFGRMLDLDRVGTPVKMLYVYGVNMKIKF